MKQSLVLILFSGLRDGQDIPKWVLAQRSLGTSDLGSDKRRVLSPGITYLYLFLFFSQCIEVTVYQKLPWDMDGAVVKCGLVLKYSEQVYEIHSFRFIRVVKIDEVAHFEILSRNVL